MVLVDLAVVAVGIVALSAGAEAIVHGGTRLARGLRVSTLVIGLTVASLGTSLPEFMVSSLASWRGQAGIAIGNAVGSNIFNILAVLGPAALIVPLSVNKAVLHREVPVMLGASLLFVALAWNGIVGRWEGALLLGTVVVYTVYRYVGSRRKSLEREKQAEASLVPDALAPRSVTANVALMGFGVVGLSVGAHLVVDGASSIALALGVEDRLVAITVVAAGTSLPEFVVTVVSALEGKVDIGVGNVVGSCIYNLLFVVGGAAVLRPLTMVPATLRFEVPIMAVSMLVLVPMLWTDHRISRVQGGLLTLGCLAYLAAIGLGYAGPLFAP